MTKNFYSIIMVGLLMGSALVAPKASSNVKVTKAQIGQKTYTLEIAQTLSEKAKGLSERKSMPQDRGMLFIFEDSAKHPFWMKGMLFGLDFVWVNGNKVVDLTENVMLSTVPFAGRKDHDKVIELNAGQVKASKVEIGDTIYFHNI